MIAKRRFAVVDVRDLAHLPGPGTDRAEWSVLTRPEPLLLILDDRPDDATVASAAARLRTMPTVVVLVADPDQVPAALLDAVDIALTDADDPPTPWVRGPWRRSRRQWPPSPAPAGAGGSPAHQRRPAGVGGRRRRGVDLRDAPQEPAHTSTGCGSVGRSVPARGDGPCVVLDPVRPRALLVELDRPEVHNAVDTVLRDQLVDALGVAAADPSIPSVDLRGRGPSFSSGGDLHEFGSVADGATAFAVRLARHPGLAVHGVAERTPSTSTAPASAPASSGRVRRPGRRRPGHRGAAARGRDGPAARGRRHGVDHPPHRPSALRLAGAHAATRSTPTPLSPGTSIDAIEPRADWPA